MFKFTFNIGTHLFNPFTAQRERHAEQRNSSSTRGATASVSTAYTQVDADMNSNNGMRKLPAPPQRIFVETDGVVSGSAPSPTPVLSKKRGWAPSSSSPSAPSSSATSTNGWFDTPSRYVEVAAGANVSNNREYDQQDLPPAKRRKTIADSILSTALSAALIGTAVGMSAYRMWRGRGLSSSSNAKYQIQHRNATATTDEVIVDHPPPPYEQEDWVHAMPQRKVKSISVELPNPASPTSSVPRTPRSSRASKARRAARAIRYHSTEIAAPAISSPRRGPSPSKATQPSISYFNGEPDADVDDTRDELDAQLNSMDDKIRRLIEEGQKALGREVVVMNDDDRNNEEGAVDDGLDGWEDENNRNGCEGVHVQLPHSTSTTPRVPANHRKKRRQSNANVHSHMYTQGGGLHLASSTSLPSRLNVNDRVHSHAHVPRSDRSVSPQKGRPRILTGICRLGSAAEREPTSIQVIYEPSLSVNEFSSSFLSSGSISASASAAVLSADHFDFEDEDSLNLSQRMEKIRQAYRLR